MSEPKQFVLNGVCFEDVQEYVEKLRAEIATLRAKMAGMVCGTCFGKKGWWIATPEHDTKFKPCQACQPAKEGSSNG